MKKMNAVLSSVLFLFAVAAQGAGTHVVGDGDNLWNLAQRYYQDHYRWRVIAEANAGAVADPHWIYPGQVLTIPDIQSEIPVSEPEAVVEAPPAKEAPAPVVAQPPPAKTEDLSVRMPQGLTGQYPSMTRVKAETSWREDGRITGFADRVAIAGPGDLIDGSLGPEPTAAVGDRFTVWRRDAVQELDEDKRARYLQKVGSMELKAILENGRCRFLVLKSVDAIQEGDLIKRE